MPVKKCPWLHCGGALWDVEEEYGTILKCDLCGGSPKIVSIDSIFQGHHRFVVARELEDCVLVRQIDSEWNMGELQAISKHKVK